MVLHPLQNIADFVHFPVYIDKFLLESLQIFLSSVQFLDFGESLLTLASENIVDVMRRLPHDTMVDTTCRSFFFTDTNNEMPHALPLHGWDDMLFLL